MAAKFHHECERCGQIALLERVGRFRDDDYNELWQEWVQADAALKSALANLQQQTARLAAARERIDQLRELVNKLPDPVVEREQAQCPQI